MRDRDARFFLDMEATYDSIAPAFSRTRGPRPWQPLASFLDSAREKGFTFELAGSTVLDVGCGNGHNMALLAGGCRSNRYIGCDLSFELVRQARVDQGRDPRAAFVQGTMNAIPFRTGCFSLVSCIAALPHLPSKRAMAASLEQMRSVLPADSGVLLISTWRKWQARFSRQILFNYLRFKPRPGLIKVPWKDPAGRVVALRWYYMLSRKELVSLVKRHFSIAFHEVSGGARKKDNHFIIGRVRS